MGLFGSRYVTSVGTNVMRVLDDDILPNAIRNGFTKNLLEDAQQPVEYVMEELTASLGLRAHRMHSFGKRDYLYGLPSGTVHSSFAGKQASKAVIESQVGGSVTMVYYHFGPLNALHVAWKVLLEQKGYDPVSNELTGLAVAADPVLGIQKKQVFLRDMQVVVTDASLEETVNGSLAQWGTPPNAGPTPEKEFQTLSAGSLGKVTPYAVDSAAAQDYVRVDTCWTEEEPIIPGNPAMKKVLKFGSFTIPIMELGYDFTADWHQAKYTRGASTGYWLYRDQEGEHTSIDQIFENAYGGNGHFFPFGYLRYNKTAQNIDKQSRAYKDSKKLFNYLSLDFDALADGVNENPDIADVEQAMLMMAVPAESSNPMECRYLFDFFAGAQQKAQDDDHLNLSDSAVEWAVQKGLSGLAQELSKSSITIRDARFTMTLSWSNITRRRVAGSVGAVGSYSMTFNNLPSTIEVPKVGGGHVSKQVVQKRHRYRHQLNDGVYEEIEVFGLQMLYYVFEQHTVTADEDDEILLIPIDLSIAKSYNIPQREELYARSLHYIFNSRVVTKLKWYQTGLFRAIMVIIAIVVTIFSYGTGWETIGPALAIGGVVAVEAIAILLLQQLLRYLIVRFAMKIFVRVVGVKFAFIVAIVAAIAGIADGMGVEGIAGAPWAQQLLTVSTGLTNAISGQVTAEYQDLLADKEAFDLYVKEQIKTLDAAQDLLTDHNYLVPLIIFGEKPDDFYQRTVHSGNIGAFSIDTVTSYVDLALTLPKLPDTLRPVAASETAAPTSFI